MSACGKCKPGPGRFEGESALTVMAAESANLGLADESFDGMDWFKAPLQFAEKACATFKERPFVDPDDDYEKDECRECAWSRDTHKEEKPYLCDNCGAVHADTCDAQQGDTMNLTDKPLAMPGLTSYRYKSPFGFIMIGAKDHADALREANRSLTLAKWEPAVIEKLEVWNGATYTPCDARRKEG